MILLLTGSAEGASSYALKVTCIENAGAFRPFSPQTLVLRAFAARR